MAFMAAAAVAAAGAAAYGAYETGQASKRAGAANATNLAIQRKQALLQDQQAEMAKAATTDARGNRTEYIEGVGWVETPTPLTRVLMQRSDREEMARLTEDLPRQRMQREHQFRVAQDERGLAGALLARMNEGTRSLADHEADATRLGVAQAVSGPQQAGRDAMLTAMRQGTSAEASLAAASRGARDNTRVALEAARSGAPRAHADADSARMNDGLARYGTLMTRALAQDNVPFQQNELAQALQTSRMRQQGTAPYALANAAKAVDPYKMQDTGYGAAQIMGAAGALERLGSSDALDRAWTKYFGAADPGAGAISRAPMYEPLPAHKGGNWS